MILTIDLGTTLLKFAVFDEQGNIVALHRQSPPIVHPVPGEWEMDLRQFDDAIKAGFAALGRDIPLADVAAISFASQANTFVLLDSAGVPLSPIILWPDERAAALNDEVAEISADPSFRAQTGVPRMNFQFACAKLLHLQRQDARLGERAPRLFFLPDLLSYWFTGQHVTEAGVAGLSGALDIHSLQWRTASLVGMGFDGVKLPRAVRAGTDLGPISPPLAWTLGLPPGCRFVVGCLDQYAGAIGTGSVIPGRLCETTGTVLAAVRCTRRLREEAPPEVFAGPAFEPELYYEMSFSSTSANLLEHYRNQLPDRPAYEQLSALAEEAASGAPVIESAVDGQPIERCFRNVRSEHTRGQIVRGIMECVARQLASQVRSLCGEDWPDQIVSAGGAAKSRIWLEIKADVLGTQIVSTECEEPTSLGAAMFARHAVTGESLPEIARQWVRLRAYPNNQ